MDAARAVESDRSTADEHDEHGVGETYVAFVEELRRYATSRLRDAAAAEDVVQEAFVRLAIESASRGRPRSPRSWLYRVVLNLIISGARHAAVVRRSDARWAFDDVALESPETSYLSAERRRALGATLQAASSDARLGLILAARGYSGREIAHELGRSEAATRTLMSRARGHVRRELSMSYAGPPSPTGE